MQAISIQWRELRNMGCCNYCKITVSSCLDFVVVGTIDAITDIDPLITCKEYKDVLNINKNIQEVFI